MYYHRIIHIIPRLCRAQLKSPDPEVGTQNVHTLPYTKRSYTAVHKTFIHCRTQNVHILPYTKCPGPTVWAHIPPCTKYPGPMVRTQNAHTPLCIECLYTAVTPRAHSLCPYTAVYKIRKPHGTYTKAHTPPCTKCPYTAVTKIPIHRRAQNTLKPLRAQNTLTPL